MNAQTRREGRRLAFQTLFELESREGRTLEDALNDQADVVEESDNSPPTPKAVTFARRLARGVLDQRVAIDSRIAVHAPAFPVDQMAITDRVALELAVFELLHEADTPLRVAINEAVQLAKTYGGENSGRFVNGVLGTIAESLADGRSIPAARDTHVQSHQE